ncbi:MAG TPA: PAS domain-containing protein, partial [Thermoanaerobaculia bacterium]|nr:PAS domain-containing protein [Thermoanaerobaculia bacterium]
MLDRRFLDSLTIAAYRCTPRSQVLAVNDAASALLQVDESAKFHLRDCFADPSSFDELASRLEAAAVRRFRAEMTRRDGTHFWAEHNAVMRKVRTYGRVIDGVFQDVSSEVAAEDEIAAAKRELEIQHRLLTESERITGVGSWQWDIPSDFIYWSDELCRIFGVAPGKGRTFDEYLAALHPDEREMARETVAASMRTGRSYEMENRCLRPDGEIRTLYCRGDVKMDLGEPVAVFGTAQDITDRRRSERLEREREQHLRLVTEQLPALVWSTDAELHVTFARGRSLALLAGL